MNAQQELLDNLQNAINEIHMQLIKFQQDAKEHNAVTELDVTNFSLNVIRIFRKYKGKLNLE
jgi:hypothetical protein